MQNSLNNNKIQWKSVGPEVSMIYLSSCTNIGDTVCLPAPEQESAHPHFHQPKQPISYNSLSCYINKHVIIT